MPATGRPLLVGSRPPQLWPLLLSKAVLKVMAAYRSLELQLPHKVRASPEVGPGWCQGGVAAVQGALLACESLQLPGVLAQARALALQCHITCTITTACHIEWMAGCCKGQHSTSPHLPPPLLQVALFQMLTGWAQEDLLDSLAAVRAAGGGLMDRLQDGVAGWLQQARPDRLATCCLIRRNVPARTPPRIVVFCGPGEPQVLVKLQLHSAGRWCCVRAAQLDDRA